MEQASQVLFSQILHHLVQIWAAERRGVQGGLPIWGEAHPWRCHLSTDAASSSCLAKNCQTLQMSLHQSILWTPYTYPASFWLFLKLFVTLKPLIWINLGLGWPSYNSSIEYLLFASVYLFVSLLGKSALGCQISLDWFQIRKCWAALLWGLWQSRSTFGFSWYKALKIVVMAVGLTMMVGGNIIVWDSACLICICNWIFICNCICICGNDDDGGGKIVVCDGGFCCLRLRKGWAKKPEADQSNSHQKLHY